MLQNVWRHLAKSKLDDEHGTQTLKCKYSCIYSRITAAHNNTEATEEGQVSRPLCHPCVSLGHFLERESILREI